MADDVLMGKWKQIKGSVKEAWGKLTDDEIDQIDGKREQLIGKLQEKYGYERSKAEQEVDRFVRDLDVKRERMQY
jgi:uncharacterized protein YjbJ (UPF0337 family)